MISTRATFTSFLTRSSTIVLLMQSPFSLAAQPIDLSAGHLRNRTDEDSNKESDELRKQLEQKFKLGQGAASTLTKLAELALARRDWGDVKKWNKHVLSSDPANLEANYALGIAYRTTGSYKAMFLRKRDFDKSQAYFETVIDQDSSFKTVLLERAWLERYRRNWQDAVVWAHRQARLKPESVEAQIGLFRLYRILLKHLATKKTRAWLSGRTTDWDRFATSEILRQGGQLAKADSILGDMLGQTVSMSKTPLYLALVRLNLERHMPTNANQAFWQALESSQNKTDLAFLFEDAKYVFTDNELAAFRSLSGVQARRDFLKRFWTKRELAPASSIKYRLMEHYRRLLRAEKDYWYDGVRTPANNPDRLQYLEFPNVHLLNQEFNDKGLIYIRHGEPDDIARTAGENVASNESWLYHKRADRPKLMFHFLIADVGTGNNWRLAAELRDRSVLADRVGWDHSITRLYQSNSFGEFQSNLSQMSEQSREMVDFGMTHDFHTWSKDTKPIELPSEVSSFRGSDGKTRVELSWAIPLESSLEAGSDDDSTEFETGFAVLSPQYDEVAQALDSVTVGKARPSDARQIQHYNFEVEPGDYQFSFFARHESVDRTVMGGEQFDVSIRSFGRKRLEISDVVAASHVSESGAADGVKFRDVFVKLNPGHKFEISQPLFLYYEIYNLTLDASGSADYEVDVEISLIKKKRSGLGKVFGFLGGGGKKKVSISNRRSSNRSQVREYMSFDVSKLNEGDYQLRIVIDDRVESTQVEQSTKLTLLRQEQR